MPTGLALPVRANGSGGFLLASGNDQDSNVIKLALADTSNENAFQQNIGLGLSMIFDINDPGSRASVIARLRSVFKRFERLKRFKLLENTLDWSDREGETVLAFKYINLETDEVQNFQRNFLGSDAGSGGDSPNNG
jgi:hypothetical protein